MRDRPKSRLPRASISAAALLAVCWVSHPAPAAAVSSADTASQFVNDINQLRASEGVAALSWSSDMVEIASPWSEHMEEQGSLSHNPRLASEAPAHWQLLGENVGVGADEPDLQRAFTNSAEHRAVMLDPRFTVIGVAVVVNSSGWMFVTEDYMQPGAPAAAFAAPPAAPAPPPPRPVAAPTTVTPPVPTTVQSSAEPAVIPLSARRPLAFAPARPSVSLVSVDKVASRHPTAPLRYAIWAGLLVVLAFVMSRLGRARRRI